MTTSLGRLTKRVACFGAYLYTESMFRALRGRRMASIMGTQSRIIALLSRPSHYSLGPWGRRNSVPLSSMTHGFRSAFSAANLIQQLSDTLADRCALIGGKVSLGLCAEPGGKHLVGTRERFVTFGISGISG